MQVETAGMFAIGDLAAPVWQYRQLMPSFPAWSLWLYLIGCSGPLVSPNCTWTEGAGTGVMVAAAPPTAASTSTATRVRGTIRARHLIDWSRGCQSDRENWINLRRPILVAGSKPVDRPVRKSRRRGSKPPLGPARISVPRDRCVDLARPRVDAALQVPDPGETVRLEELERPHAAAAVMAEQDHRAVRVELADPVREHPQRDQHRPFDVRDLLLVALAHVDQHVVLTSLAQRLVVAHRQLDRSDHGRFRPGGSGTPGIVVDEPGERRVAAAQWTRGILAQTQLAGTHAQRVGHPKPPEQPVAQTEQQPDRPHRLPDADHT